MFQIDLVINLHICQTTRDHQNINISDHILRHSSQEANTLKPVTIIKVLIQYCFEMYAAIWPPAFKPLKTVSSFSFSLQKAAVLSKHSIRTKERYSTKAELFTASLVWEDSNLQCNEKIKTSVVTSAKRNSPQMNSIVQQDTQPITCQFSDLIC